MQGHWRTLVVAGGQMERWQRAASRDIGTHEVLEKLGRERTGASYFVFACLAAAASACSALRCSHSRVDSISVTTMPPLTHTATQGGNAGSSSMACRWKQSKQQDVPSSHMATMLNGRKAQPATHLSHKTGSSVSAIATCLQTGCENTSAPAQARLRGKQGHRRRRHRGKWPAVATSRLSCPLSCALRHVTQL